MVSHNPRDVSQTAVVAAEMRQRSEIMALLQDVLAAYGPASDRARLDQIAFAVIAQLRSAGYQIKRADNAT